MTILKSIVNHVNYIWKYAKYRWNFLNSSYMNWDPKYGDHQILLL